MRFYANARKLSYKEQQELKELPNLIDSLEKRQLELEKTMAESLGSTNGNTRR